MSMLALPPLSLYVHFPWCVRKCPYCDFNSHEPGEKIPQHEYIDALLADLEHDLPLVAGREIVSIFFGGGTPSLFAPEQIDRLIEALENRLRFADKIEITLEANPGTLEQHHFGGYRSAGVNRLSIGVQSFDDHALKSIGRIHDRDEAVRAVESAQRAGFERINLDLMFGLPGASQAQTLRDLQTAIDLDPGHISWYQLTLEPNTAFHHAPPPSLPDDDALWRVQRSGIELLDTHGYQQYEISAYSREAQQCIHNLNYWQFGDYLGIGAGAHAKLTAANTVLRRWRQRHPRSYLQQATSSSVISGESRLSLEDRALEFMMNALRLNQGFELDLFKQRTGLELSSIASPLQIAQDRGLIEVDEYQIKPTATGRLHLNELLGLFVS
ncbi:YggW family oxidoreductase [Solemya pervernicosa gill symbiont]|uniref:Heme chaperone HemW n=2 Tax=Gammaproteobacteria incertae sedis TaxID=118884 RepID=A0A1T2LB52_9GAMM|nr:radical SAM family heme chaperone HemW [Candidatus Reidiella endopervernicosa]OOZ42300.1 YggW family oxidoreductase [Solemya pervernicosa gill symbiont]QKQ25695.1 radical SAM family heme chaperone HemW [Candidatus Reidiella endopervernicosa]